MLKKIKNNLNSNKINIAKISSGTLIGQLISIITMPILTRIYGAEVIGIWTLFNAVAIIVNSFSDLGLTNSVMIQEEGKLKKTYKVITTIVIIISLLSSIVITLYYGIFSNQEKISLLFIFVFFICLIFTTQQIQVCYTWLNRNGEYGILMKNPLIKNGIFSLTAIILGIFGMKTYGYFIGYMVGQVVTLIHMKRNLPKSMVTFKLDDYKEIIIDNKRFVKYQLPTNMLGIFKNQLPTLLIKAFWGNEMLGYYSITVTVLGIPISLLGSAIGRVFFQTISKMKEHKNDIGNYALKNITKGIKISILPIALLMAFGDVAALVFLGEEWKIAGEFIRILSMQYFFMLLMSTVQGLEITIQKQGYAMISCVIQIFSNIVCLAIGRYLFNNIYIGLILMAVFFSIINITYFSLLFRSMNINSKKYIVKTALGIIVITILSIILRLMGEYCGIIDFIYRIFGLQ